MKNKISRIGGCIIPILLLSCVIPSIFSNTIWVDEAYSVELAKHSIWDLIITDAMDVHPPLYYIILKVGYLIGAPFFQSNLVWTGKFVSVIPYILLVFIGLTIVRKNYGAFTGLLFSIFVVSMPQMLIYSTEIRMFGWGMLFVFCAFLSMTQIMNNEKPKVYTYLLLTIFSALAAYTHYFACAAAIVIYAEIIILEFIQRRFKTAARAVLSGIGVVILYIPWLLVFFKQVASVSENYWIPPITMDSVLEYSKFLITVGQPAADAILYTIFIIGIVLSLVLCLKEKCFDGLFGILVWVGTILLGIILSLIIRPVFVSRYMIPAAACMWLGISISYSRIDRKLIKIIVLLCVLFVGIVVNRRYYYDEEYYKTQTDYSIDTLRGSVEDATIILSNDNQIQRVVGCFFPNCYNIVLGAELSDLTAAVYKDVRLGAIDSISEIKDISDSMIVLDSDRTLVTELTEYNVEKIGSLVIGPYSFDAYTANLK